MGEPLTDPKDRRGLPPRPFLYTIDQVATLLAMSETSIERVLYLTGRSIGPQPQDRLKAVNMAAEGEDPVWRIPENDLVRWLRRKGIRIYDRSWERFGT